MLSHLRRYFHTAKYLMAVQWLAFAQKPLRKLISPKDRSPEASLRILSPETWKHGVATPGVFTPPNIFTFLNKSQSIEIDREWVSSDATALWSFNLHYFHYLFHPNCSEEHGLALIAAWIKNSRDPIAWHPYPTSLRVVNWIRFHLEIGELPQEALGSLWHQADSLGRNLETHLLANHYFANAKALLFAGLYLECEESNKWLRKAVSILQNQLDEQFLEDGSHFERSPMYHRALTIDLLDIFNALQSTTRGLKLESLLAKVLNKIPPALNWMQEIAHQENIYPLFGDSAYKTAPSDNDIFDYAHRLGIEVPTIERKRLKHFPESGFVAATCGRIKLIADIGSIVADYQPGHAHADLLGFECSYDGKRVFIDTGVDRYTLGEERCRQRSTGAHCTVSVDGKNSNEVWASFRVARRGRTSQPRITEKANEILIECSHNGYKNQSIAGIHRRQWQLSEKELIVSDEVEVSRPCNIGIHFIIHPDFEVFTTEVGTFILHKKDDKELAFATLTHSPDLLGITEAVPVCLEFGLQKTGTRITISDRATEDFLHSTRIEFFPSFITT